MGTSFLVVQLPICPSGQVYGFRESAELAQVDWLRSRVGAADWMVAAGPIIGEASQQSADS